MRNAESLLQRAIVNYVRLSAPDVLIFAVPNASRRTTRGFASNAVPGLMPGIPDLCIVMSAGRCAFAEIKTELGKLSKAQSDMLDRMDDMSVPYAIVRSLQDMQDFLYRLGIKTRARIAA